MSPKLRRNRFLLKFLWCGIGSLLFCVLVCPTRAESESKTNRVTEPKVRIGDKDVPLFFHEVDVEKEVKTFIAEDIQRLLEPIDRFEIKTRGPWGADPFGRKKRKLLRVTPEQEEFLPDIEKSDMDFVRVIETNGAYHLVVNKEITNMYREKWDIKQKNPGIFEKFDELVKMVNDDRRVEKILKDSEWREKHIYVCGNMPMERYVKGLRNWFLEANRELRPFSVYYVKRISEPSLGGHSMLEKAKKAGVEFVGITIIKYEKENGEMGAHGWPFGVYVDGEWKLFACNIMP